MAGNLWLDSRRKWLSGMLRKSPKDYCRFQESCRDPWFLMAWAGRPKYQDRNGMAVSKGTSLAGSLQHDSAGQRLCSLFWAKAEDSPRLPCPGGQATFQVARSGSREYGHEDRVDLREGSHVASVLP